jgi:hypothetical protein
MIVRISGEDQYELDDAEAARLSELQNDAAAIVEGGRADEFPAAYAALLDFVRSNGTPLGEDDLRPSEVILPPSDLSFAEAGREFTGEGLIPD